MPGLKAKYKHNDTINLQKNSQLKRKIGEEAFL